MHLLQNDCSKYKISGGSIAFFNNNICTSSKTYKEKEIWSCSKIRPITHTFRSTSTAGYPA